MKKNTANHSEREEDSFFVQNLTDSVAKDQLEGQLLVADRLFHSMLEGVLITDTTGVIVFFNPAFSAITGYGEEVIGSNPRILQSGKQNKDFYRQMWQSIERDGQWKGEMWNTKKNGDLLIQWTTISKITDDVGNPLYYASVFSDITERRKAEQQLHHDLLLAREVQKGALSQSLQHERIHINGTYLPSDLLGGDMYNWYQIDDDRYGVFLMDVMGHGVASALICMGIRSLLRSIITTHQEPDKVPQEVNHHTVALLRSGDSLLIKQYYLTGIYTVIDTKKKTITYASAGHPPGLFINEKGEVTELDVGTVPLGMLQEIDVPTAVHDYKENSKIIFYTDGIIEDEQKSTRENIEQLKKIVVGHRELAVDELLHQTITDLLDSKGSHTFQDDATLVAVALT